MQPYLETAQAIVAEVFASLAMRRTIRRGQYKRVIPATPSVAGSTMESSTIGVLLYQFTGQGPMVDTLWKPKDYVAMIQQGEVPLFGEPQEKDQLTIFPLPDSSAGDRHYHVLRGWEAAPGLMWHLQLRQN